MKQAAMLMGTSNYHCLIMLQSIYDALEDKANAVCEWHALTCCDTTGHIRGN